MFGTPSATRPPWLCPGGLPNSGFTMELSVDTISTSQKSWQTQECTSIRQLPHWPCPPYTHTMSMSTQWLHTQSVWDHTPVSIEYTCLKMVSLELHRIITAEPLYNGHHWDQGFVLYSEVPFAQGMIVDHSLLTTVASYAGASLWTMRSVVLIKIYWYLALKLDKNQGHIWVIL